MAILSDQVNEFFNTEFSSLKHLFEIHELQVLELLEAKNAIPQIEKPGIYIYIQGNEIWKVGKSNSNAKKRSLQHIKDNTGGIMSSLKECPDLFIKYFMIKDSEKIYWLYALEIYFETKFREMKILKIHSARLS